MSDLLFWTYQGKDHQFRIYCNEYEFKTNPRASEYDVTHEFMELVLASGIIPIYMGRKDINFFKEVE